MEVFANVRCSLRRRGPVLAMVLLCMFAGLARAQSANDDASVDPPTRVARLSFIEGDLGFLPAGAAEWSDASINRPLTTGDRLSTAQGARAELELGGGTLRIAGQTDFGLLNLNDQLTQIELTQGSLNISVRSLDPGQSYEIDTPTLALVVDQPGTFRVDIDGNGQSTEVSALDGNATVYGENSAQRPINAGHRYRFDDTGLVNGTIADLSGGDAFDAWCSNRDRQYAQSTTTQYVSQDVVGYQDLAQNGDWDSYSDYGAVWYPSNVDSNWAPYQDGSWAYIAPWGWSWVDNARWGFAPYHYGRWAHTHRGWGWIPGPIGVRPVYAPALVAFVGGGADWGRGHDSGRPGYVGLGGAGPIHPIGWFPLGPGEIYNPWYRSSRRYYGNVNITNIRVINNNRGSIISHIDTEYGRYRSGLPGRGERYVNRSAPHGFTAIPGAAFSGGRNVKGQLLKVDPREVASAPVLARGSTPHPTPVNVAGPRSNHARSLPLAGFQRDVVARQAPPTAALQRGGREPRSAMADMQRPGSPGGNIRPGSRVRVLSRHYGNGPLAAPAAVMPANGNRDVAAGPRAFGASALPVSRTVPATSSPVANAPASVQRAPAAQVSASHSQPSAQTGRLQNRGEPNHVMQGRSVELPSARYAPPQAGEIPGRVVNPRGTIPSPPTVSYIAGGNDSHSRVSDQRAQTLPQVPRIQRASAVNQPSPQNNPPQPRFQRPENNLAPRDFNRAPQPAQPLQQVSQQQMEQRQLLQQQQAQQMQLQRQQQQMQIQQLQREQQALMQQRQQQQAQLQMQLQMQQQRQQQMQQRPQTQIAAPAQRAAPQRVEPRQAERAARRDDQH
ncbi:DUF6600 domain-containing protein [Rhodanobacter sp. BL-MT-08]